MLVLDEQAAADEVAKEVDQLVLGRAGDDGEEVEGDPAPEHGGGLEDPPLGRLELVELGPHDLGEAPRQRLSRRAGRGRRAGSAEQLLEEERVAAGPGVERFDDAERRRPAVDGGEEGADVEGGEAAEPDVGDGVAALEARQQFGDGVAPVDGVGAVRADQHQRAAVGLGQALEQR